MGIPMAGQLGWRTRTYGFLVLVACCRGAAVRPHKTKRFANRAWRDLSERWVTSNTKGAVGHGLPTRRRRRRRRW